MSRYIGPRLKIMRALGVELPGLPRNPIDVKQVAEYYAVRM